MRVIVITEDSGATNYLSLIETSVQSFIIFADFPFSNTVALANPRLDRENVDKYTTFGSGCQSHLLLHERHFRFVN